MSDKKLKMLIKLVAIIVTVILIPVGGIATYSVSNEHGEVPIYNWSCGDEFNALDINSYQLDNNGEFKILQLSDPQFLLPLQLSGKTTLSISNLIAHTQPDLIVIAGDLTASPINGVIYKQFVHFMDGFGIPYAVVFGNHDSEGRATKSLLGNILAEGEYSVFEYGPSNIKGLGNYVININNDNDDTAWSLFMIDSNEYFDKSYDYIHESQIEWYCWNISNMQAINNNHKSLAFFHIPLPEFQEAWNKRDTDEVIHHFGDKREEECHSKVNSGLFNTMVEKGSTKGVFVGHDHVNDYSVTYQGVRLTYGLKTGISSYHMDGVRGGLLITLTEDDYTVEQIFMD